MHQNNAQNEKQKQNMANFDLEDWVEQKPLFSEEWCSKFNQRVGK